MEKGEAILVLLVFIIFIIYKVRKFVKKEIAKLDEKRAIELDNAKKRNYKNYLLRHLSENDVNIIMNPRSGYNLEYKNQNYKQYSKFEFLDYLPPMSINEIDNERKKEKEKKDRELQEWIAENHRKETRLLEEKRRKQILEKRKFEKTIYIYNNRIKLESKYIESNDKYEVSIYLKESLTSIIDIAKKSGFNLTSGITFMHKLSKFEPCSKDRIDYFVKFWQYKFPDLLESENRLPKNIKYTNYIDDNDWISFDYLTFNYLNYSWKFNLGGFTSFTVNNDSSIFSSYVLNRSDFSPYSLSHENYVLAQFILSKNERDYNYLLEKALSNNDKNNYVFENYKSEEFEKYLIEFNRKWGW